MRCGLVGEFTNYRNTVFKGTKYGLIDVVFHGDLDFPTECHEIKVHDPKMCAFLIETKAKMYNPILTMSCSIDINSKEPYILLLEIISVDVWKRGPEEAESDILARVASQSSEEVEG
jgi:hypothetical protein